MPVTVNITFENWIFKWIPHLFDPFLSVPLWEKIIWDIKVNIIFHLHHKENGHFYIPSLLLSDNVRFELKTFPRVLISTIKHMPLSPFKCRNNMKMLDEKSYSGVKGRDLERRSQSPFFQRHGARVSVPPADAASLCRRGAAGPGSAASAASRRSAQSWSGPKIRRCHSTCTCSFVAERWNETQEGAERWGGDSGNKNGSRGGEFPAWDVDSQRAAVEQPERKTNWIQTRRGRLEEFGTSVSALSP